MQCQWRRATTSNNVGRPSHGQFRSCRGATPRATEPLPDGSAAACCSRSSQIDDDTSSRYGYRSHSRSAPGRGRGHLQASLRARDATWCMHCCSSLHASPSMTFPHCLAVKLGCTKGREGLPSYFPPGNQYRFALRWSTMPHCRFCQAVFSDAACLCASAHPSMRGEVPCTADESDAVTLPLHAPQVCAALYSLEFEPHKLHVFFLKCGKQFCMKQPTQRKYTLTHNDFTGRLMLTIGTEWNYPQISSTYTHMLRDEILAEWKIGGEESPSLHVYCHVSGEALWLAPPTVRNYVFRRDMKLVRLQLTLPYVFNMNFDSGAISVVYTPGAQQSFTAPVRSQVRAAHAGSPPNHYRCQNSCLLFTCTAMQATNTAAWHEHILSALGNRCPGRPAPSGSGGVPARRPRGAGQEPGHAPGGRLCALRQRC